MMFTQTYTGRMTAMLRVRADVRDRAAQLAESAGVSMGELVAHALDAYEKELFWKQTQEALMSGADEEDEEDRLWEATLTDGLEDADG